MRQVPAFADKQSNYTHDGTAGASGSRNVKTLTIRLLAMFAALAIGATAAHAEDIDIFGGVGGSAKPNVLIIVDNTSSNDAAFASACPYTGSPANLPNSKLLDMVYCALYGVAETIKTEPSLLSKLNVGLMSGGSGSNKGGEMYYPASSPYNLPLFDLTGIVGFQNTIIAGIPKALGNAKLDGDMQEAWAFFTGNTGPRSGTSYSAHIGTLSCQKSFIILIGAASKQGRPCTGSGCGSASELAAAGATAAQQVQINTSILGTNTADDGSWIDEWARFLNQTDFNNNANDRQNIVTYTIAAGGDVADYVQLLQSTANVGGGKAFVGFDYASMRIALLQIFNEISAVNSVFASSSLPISSNTQGTYQNQIFVGMFRPDAGDGPRWMGNLKQYQFGVGGTTADPTLFLADAVGSPAVSAGTGFITPTAVSFWTKKNTSTLPDNISSTGGFWVNNLQGSGGGFDSPDGEIVEKGGVGQQLRLANLQDNYSTNPSSPRNVYTCTGSTGSCANGSSLSATPFATTNSNLTQAAFGITGPTSSVSSISRTGNVVTMALSAAPSPALTNGQNVTVSGAANTELNGNFTIGLVSATSFTYTIIESPPTPSTGTYTASLPSTPKAITTLTRTGATGTTATATITGGHGFSAGQKITIIGATQSEYNGAYTIAVPNATTFTYTITPGPVAPTTGGGADIGVARTNPITFTAAQISRGATNSDATFSTTVTVLLGSALPASYVTGAQVNVSGVVPGAYDGTYTILFGGGNSQGSSCPGNPNSTKAFCYKINTSPAFPATGSPTADPSVSVAIASGGLAHTIACSGASPTPSVTVTATTAVAHPFTAGQTVNISGTPGARESAYIGAFAIKAPITSTTFTFNSNITTTPPCAPSASGVSVSTGTSSIDKDSLINWVRGYDNLNDELSPGNGITIRPSVHGDVLHSRPTVVNYSGSVVVFYGSNDGTFRAINGNQPLGSGNSIGSTKPGEELWSFIPTEFFTRLKRQYLNTPLVKLATTPSGLTPTPMPKDYFFDGSPGIYQNGSTVNLYLSARRGGRFVYGLNVDDPSVPKFLWKKSNSDMGELGYTWSTPKPARVRGYSNPVVIFGGGYDPNEDSEPPTADTMGRGIFIVDATNGNPVWSVTYGAGGTGSCTGTCTLTDMTYAIPADITLLNRDFDASGYIDRLYAADLGGNIWRVDLEPAGYGATGAAGPGTNLIDPSTWKVTKFAALGGASGDATKRKFFYPPDVVATKAFDMVLAGTGDREHPLYSANSSQAYSIVNRFYGLKDLKTGSDATGATTITDATSSTGNTAATGMTDATTTPYDQTTANNGFYITFTKAGEKAVNAPTTVGGFTYIGTSQPPAPTSLACNNMGTARGYQINFLTGASASVTFASGGLPPSPVAGLVTVAVGGVDRLVPFCLGCGNPAGGGADATSSIGGGKPPIPVPPIRKRLYWYLDKHDN